ncbi:MAG TPA: UDP-N-acetylmuramoyl-tripeptide--D-alanyl-D-alanine ligase [Nitrospiraceae bacterium]|nr:UDP-N-acetylmuramoyl-tripeptide--D-alanyl-D-alanine ligase [Nitrospiraceae bacterium]
MMLLAMCRQPAPIGALGKYTMPLFIVDEIREITSARLLTGWEARVAKQGIRRLCTDSRDIGTGDLFVAIKGERMDGHDFVPAALKKGAVGALVQDDYRLPPSVQQGTARGPVVLGVPDTLRAYQQLAAYHRNRFQIPVVAVTGSNGKTTTKEMVADVLAQRWPVLRTEGNLNNRLGVPQTLFKLALRHKAAVIEMGVDQTGQTARLCEIARPTIGLITNIGPDHLEFFGTMDVSAQAKGELLEFLPPEGRAVLNADDVYFGYLASRAHCEVLSFGLSSKAQVRAEQLTMGSRQGTQFHLRLPGRGKPQPVSMRVHGVHNILNALAAAAVGHAMGLSSATIAEGLARFRPAAMRSQVLTVGGIRIINDCYNANPASMKAAIDLLLALGAGARSVAVLGDMLELGPSAPALHHEVGAYLAERGVTHLIACGTLGRHVAEGARTAGMATERVVHEPDAAHAGAALQALAQDGDVVLVKASRGMKMEQAVEMLAGPSRETATGKQAQGH